MDRRKLLYVVGLVVAGLLLAARSPAADEPKSADHHAGHMMECSKACAECMRACESCAHHCAHMVADGKKDHLLTLGTCADCGSICSTAAKVTARHGPLAVPICEGCAKACAACGEACAKFPDDEHMKRCAEECRRCEKACRDMIEHVGQQSAK
jgi:hypothetical protein